MRIVWSPEAREDLARLRAYIAQDNPGAAGRIALRVIEGVETVLPAHPAAGRPGRVPGTRELVVTGTPFIVPYRLRGGAVEVLRVYHGAQRWPQVL